MYINVYLENGYNVFNDKYEYICVAGSEKLKTLKDISDCLKLFKKDYPQEKGYYYSLDFYADILD